jgi:hypothetical protein
MCVIRRPVVNDEDLEVSEGLIENAFDRPLNRQRPVVGWKDNADGNAGHLYGSLAHLWTCTLPFARNDLASITLTDTTPSPTVSAH